MYRALLEIVPKGPLRTTVFQQCLQFLRGSPVETSSPSEWAVDLLELLKQRFEENDQAEFLHSVAESGDATMQAYATLTALSSDRR